MSHMQRSINMIIKLKSYKKHSEAIEQINLVKYQTIKK